MRQLQPMLEDAVRMQLVSDVPVGVFLSGGIDSSALVSILSRGGVTPSTFSIVFREADFSEAQHSRAVAEKFRTGPSRDQRFARRRAGGNSRSAACDGLADNGWSKYVFGLRSATGLLSLEPFNQAMIVKPLVGADYNRSDARRNLGEAGVEKVAHAGGGMGVTGPQFPVPEVSALALEAQQRMVGWSPTLGGIVTDPGLFLLAIDHQHRGVHIEDQARGWLGGQCHAVKEAVVQSAQLQEVLSEQRAARSAAAWWRWDNWAIQ